MSFKTRLERAERDAQPGRPSYEQYRQASNRQSTRMLRTLVEGFPEIPGNPLPPPVEGDSPELRERDRAIIERWDSFRTPGEKREAREAAEWVHRKLFPEEYQNEAQS